MTPTDPQHSKPLAAPNDWTSSAQCAAPVADALQTLQAPAELYHCPGDPAPISRAVHLGRLAQYYPACRRCVHGQHAEGLSPRRARRLAEVRRRRAERPLFDAEGAGGVWLNRIQPAGVRTLGRAFGQWVDDLRGHGPAERPLVVVAGDGRVPAAEALAALGEGLRWAGCQVIEGGAATAACVGLAVQCAGARGGVWVGNPNFGSDEVHLSFFDEQARPLCAGAGLEELEALAAGPLSRPARCAGGLRRRQIEEDYLRKLSPWYHGLRPLRLVLDAASPGSAKLLKRLAAPTACCILGRRVSGERLGEQVRREQAHLGVRIDGNAERCEVFDETGRRVPAEQWLVLLARFRLEQRVPGPVILDPDGQARLKAAFEQLGLEVKLSADSRREMACVARRTDALLAGDTAGRCCLDLVGPAMADALQVVTLLLNLLSRSDQTLSEVLRGPAV